MKNVLTMLLLALVMAGCHSSKPIQQAPQAVQTQRLDSNPANTSGGLRFSAVVTPDAEVPLSFRIPGYVIALKQVRGQDGRMRDIAEGDRVSKGAVLVRIRAAEYEDKVRQATSQAAAVDAVMQKAKLDFDRATRLYGTQSITKPDFDAARAQYDSTESQLRAARAQTSEAEIALHDTSVVAPFDGDIVKKSVELGAFVGPGVPAFAIAKTDLVKIVVGVPDTVVRSIKLGQPVEVAIDAFPNAHLSCTNQPHVIGSRCHYAQLRRRGRYTQPRSLAEGGHDRFFATGRWRKRTAALVSAGSAFGDRAGERRQIRRVCDLKFERRRSSEPP